MRTNEELEHIVSIINTNGKSSNEIRRKLSLSYCWMVANKPPFCYAIEVYFLETDAIQIRRLQQLFGSFLCPNPFARGTTLQPTLGFSSLIWNFMVFSYAQLAHRPCYSPMHNLYTEPSIFPCTTCTQNLVFSHAQLAHTHKLVFSHGQLADRP